MTECYLWTGQFPEVQRVLTKGNNQSMELYEPMLKGFWSEDDNGGPSFFIINEAIISKLCILGEDVEPCFEGAQITRVQFSFEDSFKEKLFKMMEEVKEIMNEGGTNSVEDEVKNPELEEEVKDEEKPEEEAPVEEEKAEDPAPAEYSAEEQNNEEQEEENAEEEAEEEEQEEETPEENSEDKKVEYNLDEIQEYIELKSNFDELQTKFNEMKAVYDELVEFKNAADRKEKQAMIDQFYMLSNEDKKDVIDNIDTYSLDEIEAKLSVICVRNKVNLNALTDDDDEDINSTFTLEDGGVDDDVTPAWIKAVLNTKKEME
jgi:flagellar motor component MotA